MLNREFLIFVLTFQGYRADHEPGDTPVEESSANENYVEQGYDYEDYVIDPQFLQPQYFDPDPSYRKY